MRKMSLVVASVVSAISCIVVMPPANAQKMGIDLEPLSGSGTFSGVCAFDVQFAVAGKAGQITLPGGRFISTSPGVHITLTNANDPTKSVTLNVTGAFHQSTDATRAVTTVATGRNLLFDPDAGFVLAIGSFSFKFDTNGILVQPLAGTGQLIKVCPMIS